MKMKEKIKLNVEAAEKLLQLMLEEKGGEALEEAKKYGIYCFAALEREVVKLTGKTWKKRSLEMDVARNLDNLLKNGKIDEALEIGKAYGFSTLEEIERAYKELLGITKRKPEREDMENIANLLRKGNIEGAKYVARQFDLYSMEEIRKACEEYGISI